MYSKTCVRCKKKINEKMKICPFCNMPNKIPSTKKKAFCPKCNVALLPKFYKKLELDICPSCAGIWLDTLEFEYVTTEKDVYSDPDIEPSFVCDPPERIGRLYPCVRCDNLMNRINFKSISGILVDICGDHGVWLDENELTRLRRFIASGGLDKVQDREIFKNKGSIEKLAGRVDNVEFLQRMMHRWNLKYILLRGGKIV